MKNLFILLSLIIASKSFALESRLRCKTAIYSSDSDNLSEKVIGLTELQNQPSILISNYHEDATSWVNLELSKKDQIITLDMIERSRESELLFPKTVQKISNKLTDLKTIEFDYEINSTQGPLKVVGSCSKEEKN